MQRRPGLYNNEDAVMMHDGKPFHGIGINYFDMFLSVFPRGGDKAPTLSAMETLKKYDCKVIRFAVLPFYAEEFSYYEDTQNFWSAMDAIVNKAEELKIGLLPSLFWTYSVNDYCDEPYQSAFFDPESKTVRFTRKFTEEFVRRYCGSEAIYGWE